MRRSFFVLFELSFSLRFQNTRADASHLAAQAEQHLHCKQAEKEAL